MLNRCFILKTTCEYSIFTSEDVFQSVLLQLFKVLCPICLYFIPFMNNYFMEKRNKGNVEKVYMYFNDANL